QSNEKPDRVPDGEIPLCVDLDGTFIRSNLLLEGFLRFARHRPLELWRVPFWLLKGRCRLKAELARALAEPLSPPPVNRELEAWMLGQKQAGRLVYLVTAAHADAVAPVGKLFPFDGIIASNDEINLKGRRKAEHLVARFGEKGFDYAGDSLADHHVWARARKAIPVFYSRSALRAMERRYDVARSFCTNATRWTDWAGALRIHQWAKNLLIALPVLAGHHFHTVWQLGGLLAAFLAMSLCASGTYLWNDLLDLEYDRAHPRKCRRLAASGKTSLTKIALASCGLVAAGLAGAWALAPSYALLLCGYIAATLSYSLYFKRVALADIFLLAFLYLSRVIGGILISEAKISFWLFAFTFLLFLSLAAAKRFVELRATIGKGGAAIDGRGYLAEDLPTVSGLGIACGVASCIVLGLYSNSPQVTGLYAHPQWFWGVCTAALYWICRIWLITHRGLMHDDPVVFALKDRVTWLIALAGLGCVLLAQPLPAP
ncbi:MAG: UbiA family prenyltransferase, partial [Verrucomicrobia bacterium]|nr:UbiA family prenyltransferase [Verrucomicrobiota bacterium]